LILGLIGMTAYLSSNKTFEILGLAKIYINATASEKLTLINVGQVMINEWQGTAFDIYYILNAITLFIVSYLMLGSKYYKRSTAIYGLISAIFMALPPTVGKLGIIFSLLSLIPRYIFTIKYSKVFRRLSP
jgi:hypothetical protein